MSAGRSERLTRLGVDKVADGNERKDGEGRAVPEERPKRVVAFSERFDDFCGAQSGGQSERPLESVAEERAGGLFESRRKECKSSARQHKHREHLTSKRPDGVAEAKEVGGEEQGDPEDTRQAKVEEKDLVIVDQVVETRQQRLHALGGEARKRLREEGQIQRRGVVITLWRAAQWSQAL